MRNKRFRPVAATLILAVALATFGCRQPLQGADMTNKPLAKQAEKLEDVKPKTIKDVVPTKAEPKTEKDVNGETKKEKSEYPHLRFKERKRVSPVLEFK